MMDRRTYDICSDILMVTNTIRIFHLLTKFKKFLGCKKEFIFIKVELVVYNHNFLGC